jgi:hypothetical protein
MSNSLFTEEQLREINLHLGRNAALRPVENSLRSAVLVAKAFSQNSRPAKSLDGFGIVHGCSLICFHRPH